jgi:uncharacterized protein
VNLWVIKCYNTRFHLPEKIVEENKFKAVIGVACYQDLNLAMWNYPISRSGGPLLQDGCMNTKVDTRVVLEKMGVELCKSKNLPENNSCSQESSS